MPRDPLPPPAAARRRQTAAASATPCSLQFPEEPVDSVGDAFCLAFPEVVTRVLQHVHLHTGIRTRDSLQNGQRTKRITIALDNQRRTTYRFECCLVLRPWPIAWRDWMPEDHQRSRRLDRSQPCAHPSAKRPAH